MTGSDGESDGGSRWPYGLALVGGSATVVSAVLNWQGVASGPVAFVIGLLSGTVVIVLAIREYALVRGGRSWRLSLLALLLVIVVVSTGTVVAALRDGPARAENGSVRIVGGCEPFMLYGQNRWSPFGAKIMDVPRRTATQIGSVAPNKIIYADGWVRTEPAIPLNSPPWDSDVWFHLIHDEGWVSFPGVRAVATAPDPEHGYGEDGGEPAPVLNECKVALR